MEKEDSNKSNNTGCIIASVIGVLFFWGFQGMMNGYGFAGYIEANIKALGILLIAGLVLYGLFRIYND